MVACATVSVVLAVLGDDVAINRMGLAEVQEIFADLTDVVEAVKAVLAIVGEVLAVDQMVCAKVGVVHARHRDT